MRGDSVMSEGTWLKLKKAYEHYREIVSEPVAYNTFRRWVVQRTLPSRKQGKHREINIKHLVALTNNVIEMDVSQEENKLIQEAARASGVTVEEWVKRVVMIYIFQQRVMEIETERESITRKLDTFLLDGKPPPEVLKPTASIADIFKNFPDEPIPVVPTLMRDLVKHFPDGPIHVSKLSEKMGVKKKTVGSRVHNAMVLHKLIKRVATGTYQLTEKGVLVKRAENFRP
jgi:hypothetical protein